MTRTKGGNRSEHNFCMSFLLLYNKNDCVKRKIIFVSGKLFQKSMIRHFFRIISLRSFSCFSRVRREHCTSNVSHPLLNYKAWKQAKLTMENRFWRDYEEFRLRDSEWDDQSFEPEIENARKGTGKPLRTLFLEGCGVPSRRAHSLFQLFKSARGAIHSPTTLLARLV